MRGQRRVGKVKAEAAQGEDSAAVGPLKRAKGSGCSTSERGRRRVGFSGKG